MFDPEALKIARESIAGEASVHKSQFDLGIARLRSEAIARGALGGSGYFFALSNLCASEMEAGADRAWRIIHRAVVATGAEYSADLAEKLKSAFEDIFREYCYAQPQCLLGTEITQARRGIGIPQQDSEVNPALRAFEERTIGARRRFYAEIDLFARSLQRRPSFERGAGNNVFQIYAPVGAIQTGAGSSATVAINLDGAAKRQLVDVLEQLSVQLSDAAGLVAEDVDEIRAAIEETRQYLEKPRPGATTLLMKFQTVMTLVSSAIQIAPSLGPVYESLRAILVAHGL